MKSVDNVAGAIREGNVIFDRAYPREYTGDEIYRELELVGLEPHELPRALNFLAANQAKARTLFSCPLQIQMGVLKDMMGALSERTAVEYVDWFSACVYEVFHEQYLHKPTQRDIERLYLAHEERHGFSGMLGSLDCTHLACGKCPNAWRGQFTRGDIGEPIIV
ncbi:unnamed protein product [Lactuca saligna]|uniref:Uncharacterized protein n=1 Tax=Lactuca saligna TaxID=75948 RepID=A0AA35ZY15_LACSI|nr:unnamed protein product [Lactuca saligna]